MKECSNKVEKLCPGGIDFLNADHGKVGNHLGEAEELGDKPDNAVKQFPKKVVVEQGTADHESDEHGSHAKFTLRWTDGST